MKLYKYIPTWAYGFDAKEFEVNTKDELLNSNLCSEWINRGYTISVSPSGVQEIEGGKLMAFKRNSQERGDVRYYVIATYRTNNDGFTLCRWLPVFEHLLSPKPVSTQQKEEDRLKWVADAFEYHNRRIQNMTISSNQEANEMPSQE